MAKRANANTVTIFIASAGARITRNGNPSASGGAHGWVWLRNLYRSLSRGNVTIDDPIVRLAGDRAQTEELVEDRHSGVEGAFDQGPIVRRDGAGFAVLIKGSIADVHESTCRSRSAQERRACWR
ncbi:MAG: hypothetical protein ACI88C_002349 [Acidimicrobiales bacterium]|jgi:hypothetical protein